MVDHSLRGSRRSDAPLDAIRSAAHRLAGNASDYDGLLQLIGNARFALIGEASHGTHEFYSERVEITKRLILEKRCTAIAVEGDWPDAYRVNRYIRGASTDADADAALSGFKRFPTWMWRNTVVRDFVEWLRRYNEGQARDQQVGFYGIDLYSLFGSIDAVLTYLDKVDPEAARRARYRYSCFDHYGEDTQAYGYAASFGMSKTCEDAVVSQLTDILRSAGQYVGRDGRMETDEFFFAEQNARLVKNAEEYYRTMFRGHVSSWNLRDQHMVETLQALDRYLSRADAPARIAVWAHNSHLGDARATEMGDAGELNVGQLMREHYGDDAVLIGFTTHRGTVTAASDWGAPVERKRVRPALEGSYETLLHDTGFERFLLALRGDEALQRALQGPRLERAIGVIYLPETERVSHYFDCRLTQQFDAVIHLDVTTALEPLERGAQWMGEEAPETYPSGM
ncbi:MAG: erythromycin esterase family protein [Rhodospirillaceae bacterium]